ncbi:hypothetical protein SODG_006249 [Sodalis praecaptivus]|nr:hypothetical protein NVIRENTERO_03279 [Sodalis praecaptivus]
MTIAILLTSGMVICLLVRIAVTDIRARIITNCDIALLFAVLCTINLITGKMPNRGCKIICVNGILRKTFKGQQSTYQQRTY